MLHFARMKPTWILAAAAVVSAVVSIAPLAAQQAKPPLPKSQVPDLGRPTKVTDEQPPFSFDEYFPGKWTFEWDVPEGVLGPSGTIKGTIVYKHLDGPFYQAETTATGPGGSQDAISPRKMAHRFFVRLQQFTEFRQPSRS